MRLCTALLLAVMLAGPAFAQPQKKQPRTHSDDFFTTRVAIEIREPKTASTVKKVNELAYTWISDTGASDIITQLMDSVVKKRPDAFISLEMRRGIVEINSVLYDRTQEKKYRDTMIQTARAGIDKVIEIQSKTEYTPEYMMFLGCRFCDPFFRLDEPVQKNYLDYCKFFYSLYQNDDEITTQTKLIDCMSYAELALYERDYPSAIACVRHSLELLQTIPPNDLGRPDPVLGLSPVEQVLFLALRTAIMSGDKEKEKSYLQQFASVLKGPRGQEYQHALDWTYQRTKNPKPKVVDLPTTTSLPQAGNRPSTASLNKQL